MSVTLSLSSEQAISEKRMSSLARYERVRSAIREGQIRQAAIFELIAPSRKTKKPPHERLICLPGGSGVRRSPI